MSGGHLHNPLQKHGMKLSEMVEEQDGIDVLQPSRGLGIVDGRHHNTVIAQINEAFPDTDGPYGWAHRRMNVEVILRKDRQFLNERELISTSSQKD